MFHCCGDRTCMCAYVGMSHYTYRSQRTTVWFQYSPTVTWVPEMELSVVRSFTGWTSTFMFFLLLWRQTNPPPIFPHILQLHTSFSKLFFLVFGDRVSYSPDAEFQLHIMSRLTLTSAFQSQVLRLQVYATTPSFWVWPLSLSIKNLKVILLGVQ